MERFALFCGFWSMMLIPTNVLLAPLMLSVLPPPRNLQRIIDTERKSGVHHLIRQLLRKIASVTYGKPARITTAVVAVVAVVALVLTAHIKIGNPVEGSNLLWDDSAFNQAVRQINAHFPGVNTLEIIFEAKDQHNPSRVMHQAEPVLTMLQVQDFIERGPKPPRATLSFGDYLMEGSRLFSGGDPRWLPLDPDTRSVNAAAQAVLMGSSPKAYSQLIDFDQQNGTVSLWFKDNKQGTVDAALAEAARAVAAVGADHDAFRIRLGTGTIALQQAMNDVVHDYQWAILGLLNIVILLVCTYAYKSIVAGFILLVPVNLSNLVLGASMSLMGIGLDINTLLVAAIGVGVGIDYGIYLLSRICEEFQSHEGDYGLTIVAATTTTGKAIMFTALIMLVGILPWYFLSELKFLADMGLLLVLTMVINMIVALVVVPLLVWLVKPGFLSRKDLLIGEGIDPSLYVASDAELAAVN
jgi:hypothetical protein